MLTHTHSKSTDTELVIKCFIVKPPELICLLCNLPRLVPTKAHFPFHPVLQTCASLYLPARKVSDLKTIFTVTLQNQARDLTGTPRSEGSLQGRSGRALERADAKV